MNFRSQVGFFYECQMSEKRIICLSHKQVNNKQINVIMCNYSKQSSEKSLVVFGVIWAPAGIKVSFIIE